MLPFHKIVKLLRDNGLSEMEIAQLFKLPVVSLRKRIVESKIMEGK